MFANRYNDAPANINAKRLFHLFHLLSAPRVSKIPTLAVLLASAGLLGRYVSDQLAGSASSGPGFEPLPPLQADNFSAVTKTTYTRTLD